MASGGRGQGPANRTPGLGRGLGRGRGVGSPTQTTQVGAVNVKRERSDNYPSPKRFSPDEKWDD